MRVDFYTGPEFMRTKQRTNPFIDPIIAVCEANGIEWRVVVPSKRIKCGYDEAHIKSYRPIVFVYTWVWRISRILWRVNSWRVSRLAGKLIKFIWKDSFSSDVAVIMAGGAECFLYWSVNAHRIADLQHGVIYSRHQGYFNSNGRFLGAVNKSNISNCEFWVYGQGFADCFFKHPDNANDLQGRVKVIGDVIRAGESVGADGCRGRDETRNVVVFSLQLTADLSQEELSGSVERMEAFFTDFLAKYGDKYKCFVKHHPRFNNVHDLSAFYAKFPQVTETKAPWTELYPQMALHVTFNSTVTFDCASQGIPTFLVDFPEAKIIMRNFYRDDYGYPFYDKSVDDILGSPREEIRKTILDWYHRFYTPFSEENCCRLIYGGESYKE